MEESKIDLSAESPEDQKKAKKRKKVLGGGEDRLRT